MRKSAISTKSNKVYNPNCLEITGDHIKLLPPQKAAKKKVFAKRALKVDSLELEEAYAAPKQCQIHIDHPPRPQQYTYKHFLKTSVTNYKNTEVSNKILRQIGETSKVEDFEKILQSLVRSENYLRRTSGYAKKHARDSVLEAVLKADIYEEFIGQHVDRLQSVLDKAKDHTQN